MKSWMKIVPDFNSVRCVCFPAVYDYIYFLIRVSSKQILKTFYYNVCMFIAAGISSSPLTFCFAGYFTFFIKTQINTVR